MAAAIERIVSFKASQAIRSTLAIELIIALGTIEVIDTIGAD